MTTPAGVVKRRPYICSDSIDGRGFFFARSRPARDPRISPALVERRSHKLSVSGMLGNVRELLEAVLGLSLQAHDLDFRHTAARAAVVLCFAILLARVANRRIFSQNAGFDIIILVILASVLSRAINGAASVFPTLGAAAVLVGLHHLIAMLAFHSHGFSHLVKGSPRVLVRDGKLERQELARSKITEHDLEENLRLNGSLDSIARVKEARLERNGTVSVVEKSDP